MSNLKMYPQEENEETELPRLLQLVEGEAARHVAERLARAALQHAHDAARARRHLADTRAIVLEVRGGVENTLLYTR